MKKILLAAVALLAVACSDKGGYKVEVDVTGLEEGQNVYLSVFEGKVPKVIESTTVKSGRAHFKGKLDHPMLAEVRIDSTNGLTLAHFFLEESPIRIKGIVEQDVNVEGSASNDSYQAHLAEVKAATDAREHERVRKLREEYVAANPNSVPASYVLFRQLAPGMDADQLRAARDQFDPSLHQTTYLALVDDMANKIESTSIGQKFVDFTLPDTLGRPVALSSIAGQGSYVLLDFWASWCPPCRAENPHVVEAYNHFKDKGFTVFGVSLDRPGQADRWKKAIQDDNLHWINVSDLQFWDTEPAAMYGVRSIPANVLIDPQGTIIARNLRGQALTDKLTEVLGE